MSSASSDSHTALRRGAAMLAVSVSALVFAAGGAARSSSARLSLSFSTSPVPTVGGCLGTSAGCQTYLNPSWSFSPADLAYVTSGGSHTTSIACFAVHTDLGGFGPFAGGSSGSDSATAPQGAPEAAGAWRTWCDSGLPQSVAGQSQASLQIGSTKPGRATITAYLLRYGELGSSFSSAIIAQSSAELVFGSGATPAPAPAETDTGGKVVWSARGRAHTASGATIALVGGGSFTADAGGAITAQGVIGHLVVAISDKAHPARNDVWHLELAAPGSYHPRYGVTTMVAGIVDTANPSLHFACQSDPIGEFAISFNDSARHLDDMALGTICGSILRLQGSVHYSEAR